MLGSDFCCSVGIKGYELEGNSWYNLNSKLYIGMGVSGITSIALITLATLSLVGILPNAVILISGSGLIISTVVFLVCLKLKFSTNKKLTDLNVKDIVDSSDLRDTKKELLEPEKQSQKLTQEIQVNDKEKEALQSLESEKISSSQESKPDKQEATQKAEQPINELQSFKQRAEERELEMQQKTELNMQRMECMSKLSALQFSIASKFMILKSPQLSNPDLFKIRLNELLPIIQEYDHLLNEGTLLGIDDHINKFRERIEKIKEELKTLE